MNKRLAFSMVITVVLALASVLAGCPEPPAETPASPTPETPVTESPAPDIAAQPVRLTEPRSVTIEFVDSVRNEGPGNLKELEYFILIPPETPNQRILNFTIEPQPVDYLVDEWGQDIAHYQWFNVAPGSELVVRWTAEAKIYNIEYDLNLGRPFDLADVPLDILDEYTRDAVKYNIYDPGIQNAAKEAAGGETDMYQIVRGIFDFTMEHLEYELGEGWDDAATVLDRGNGTCSEYSFLFISLCRANGIPARYIGGSHYRAESGAYTDTVFHRMVEVYFPGYGWVPFDATWADAGATMTFGALRSKFFTISIAGAESEYLQWNYHTYHQWKYSDVKPNVEVDRSANWVPK
jgi:transglutaminase-like putative cysteine protease